MFHKVQPSIFYANVKILTNKKSLIIIRAFLKLGLVFSSPFVIMDAIVCHLLAPCNFLRQRIEILLHSVKQAHHHTDLIDPDCCRSILIRLVVSSSHNIATSSQVAFPTSCILFHHLKRESSLRYDIITET